MTLKQVEPVVSPDQRSATSGIPSGMRSAIRMPVALTVIALALGLAVEILFYGHPPGISFTLWAALCVGAVVVAGRIEAVRTSRSAWLLMIPALFFAAAVFFRQEPLTVFLSLLLTLFLLALLVRAFRFGQVGRFGWIDMAVAFLWVPIEAWLRPWSVAGEAWGRTVRERGGRRIGFSILRGILLALPVLVVFVALLSAADLVFGDYVEKALAWIDLAKLADWTARAVVILVSALFLLGALVAALRDPGERRLIGEDPPLLRPFLGFTETAIVLSLVVLVFLSFVAVQFAYLFGGQANIDAAGYTYAEYARRGFGELVAVAFLALGMIYVLAMVTRLESPRKRAVFFGLCAAIVLLVGVMLLSAYQRLILYEQAYGFSRLRTYTHLAIAWLAVAFVVFLILLGLDRLRQLAPAALAIAAGFTMTLVWLNVDAFIVDRNARRYAQSGDLDAFYLSSLSADAVPRLVQLAQEADGQEEEALLADLACRRRELERSRERLAWPSAHASRSRALDSLVAIEKELAGFPVYLEYYGQTNPDRAVYVVKTEDGFQRCYGAWD